MTDLRTLTLLLFALSVPAAHAEIFKCRGRNAIPVYQNFPCETDRPGSTASAAMVRTKLVGEGTPRPGMTADDVRRAWGEPAEIVQDEPPGGRVEIWRYKDGRSVQIDRKQRVVAVGL